VVRLDFLLFNDFFLLDLFIFPLLLFQQIRGVKLVEDAGFFLFLDLLVYKFVVVLCNDLFADLFSLLTLSFV